MLRTLLVAILLAGSTASAQTVQAPAPVPVASAPAVAVPAKAMAAPPDYKLGVQDVLKVTVFDEPTLSVSVRVDSDGAFQYPLIGRVQAAGRTLRTVETELTKRLEDGWVRRPQVSVEVEQYRSRNVRIVGQVRTPGLYPLTGPTTLIEALAKAGYLAPTAGSEILVLHAENPESGTPEVTPETAKAENTTRIRLADLEAGRLTANVVLDEGDTIFVGKAETFFVGGHVRSSGRFTWEPGMTVQQAIALAGGLTDKGSNRRLKVTRLVKGKSKKLDIALDDLVQPDDLIDVPQRLL